MSRPMRFYEGRREEQHWEYIRSIVINSKAEAGEFWDTSIQYVVLLVFLRKISLVLTVACLVLHHYSYDLTDVPTLLLCSGTYVGYVVVLSGEIVGEMIFAPLDLVQDMYFGILGTGLFTVCGGLVISARTKGSTYPRTGDYTLSMIVGSISIATAIIMFFDLTLAYLDSEEFEEDASEAVSAAADAYVDAWWSAGGGALFGACGALTLHWWRDIPPCQRRNYAQAAAVCSLAAAAVFILDALLAICAAHKEAREQQNNQCGQC